MFDCKDKYASFPRFKYESKYMSTTVKNKFKLFATFFLLLAIGKSFAQYPGKPNCEKLKSPSDMFACMEKNADCTTPSWLSGVDRSACAAQEMTKIKGLEESRLKSLKSLLDEKTKSKLNAANAAYDRFVQAQCTFEASPNEGGSQYPRDYSSCANFLKEARIKDYERVYKNFMVDSRR